jgi:hypothetical protein
MTMIEIHLYGNLRRYAGHYRPMEDVVLRREVQHGDTLQSTLEDMGIPTEEINHIFVNAKLLSTRASMAPYYGYQQQRDTVFDWDLGLPLEDGDRVGLFGTDLSVLSM